MQDENQQPPSRPTPADDSTNSDQAIQPVSSSASPSTSPPQTILQPQVNQTTAYVSITPSDISPDSVTPQTPAQPMGVVNGQPFYQQTPISSSQFEQTSGSQPSKWRYFFIVLGILQTVGVGLFFLIMSSIGGQSGSEFIALALFVTLIPAVGIIAFINLVGLPIYMSKHKPHGKGLAWSVLSLLISFILAGYGAYNLYQIRVAIPQQMNTLSDQSQQKFQAKEQQFAADNAKPEITEAEAINLLKTCKLQGFYYTNQTSKDDGNWGELSSTGVVLTKVDGQPYRISIADRLVAELVPIAREAQKTCGGPQFWHDGSYEQRDSSGNWH